VAAYEHLIARLVAVQYGIFTACSCRMGHVAQFGLATWAARHNVWRSRAMRSSGVLLVAGDLALVLAAVERSAALVETLECSCPLLDDKRTVRTDVCLTADLLLRSIMAQYVLLHLAAIATRRNSHLAGSTGPFVAWFQAPMLPAGHNLSTYLPTGPPMLVVRIDATTSDCPFPAEAVLSRPHQTTGRAWASMAGGAARMRAFLGQYTRSRARLPT